MTLLSTPIPPWAFPGNKVVCAVAFDRARTGFNELLPIKGQIYTLREVAYGDIRLVEIVNPPQPYNEAFDECVFQIQHFKPVATTDNEIEAKIYNRNSPRKTLAKKLTSA